MDRTSINRNARLVWRTLEKYREWTYEELKEATGLDDRELNAAIGWLAHEDLIYFGNCHGQNNISLGINIYFG